jgi:hypothetical protein
LAIAPVHVKSGKYDLDRLANVTVSTVEFHINLFFHQPRLGDDPFSALNGGHVEAGPEMERLGGDTIREG